jgi:hypothetical protein
MLSLLAQINLVETLAAMGTGNLSKLFQPIREPNTGCTFSRHALGTPVTAYEVLTEHFPFVPLCTTKSVLHLATIVDLREQHASTQFGNRLIQSQAMLATFGGSANRIAAA